CVRPLPGTQGRDRGHAAGWKLCDHGPRAGQGGPGRPQFRGLWRATRGRPPAPRARPRGRGAVQRVPIRLKLAAALAVPAVVLVAITIVEVARTSRERSD